MGLLDDLKKQAEIRQQVASSHDDALLQFPHFKPVQNALQEASHYFAELAQSLNVVKPDVRRQFYIEGSTKLANLQQSEYSVRDKRRTVDGRDYLVEVTLRFTCANNESLTFEKDSTRQVDMMKEYFWAYSLPFEVRDIRSDRGNVVGGVITLFGKVPSSITLSGDWDTGQFELNLRNIEVLGEVKYALDAANVQRDLLEEIGKFVLAQPNKLRDLNAPPSPAAPQRSEPAYKIAPDEPAPEPPERGLMGAIKSLIKR